MSATRPDILFVMTDQHRFDAIAALGNSHIYTPNLDRLVNRGITFSSAYATCPVCVAARDTIQTGCEPLTTRVFNNAGPQLVDGMAEKMEDRCGQYLAPAMARLGYRTFGVGKFHIPPPGEDLGYETFFRSEEVYNSHTRRIDDYASWLDSEHPQFRFVEQLMGERTEMYYLPQRSLLPAELGVESWTADRAVEQIARTDPGRSYFGFVSFIGPHPPLAPPIPFNRMYDPDRLPDPISSDPQQDYMDEEIPYMKYATWAEAINTPLSRIVKARYYGEISYIDFCLGRILDAVDAGPNAHNTLICFFSDHGDLLGDHNGWQKQNFFEASCRIPFLLSWPAMFPAKQSKSDLVSLADLVGLATGAAGSAELREGIDLLGLLREECAPRRYLIGMTEPPGSHDFKIMVLTHDWKYIFMANGGREQLFRRREDPCELSNRISSVSSAIRSELRALAVEACRSPGGSSALDGEEFRSFPFRERPRTRIYQFDYSFGVKGFPEHPRDVLKDLDRHTFRRAKRS